MAEAGGVILHIGLGAFHRAHQGAFLQRLHDAGDRSWSIVAGNMRADNAAIEQALLAQHGRYTLETIEPSGTHHYQLIATHSAIIAHEPTLAGLLRAGADARTRIISFTVSEAGYCIGGDGRLDTTHPDARHDIEVLAGAGPVRTLYGLLARILERRHSQALGGVTLLCCDNLRANGALVKDGLLRFLDACGLTTLRTWTLAHCSFPNGMVDRITPRPTVAVRERVRAATGRDDQAPVMAESHLQWVLEDDFVAGRPAWEKVGVEFVSSVHPFEEAKIRILNAGHSVLAWSGAIAGHRHVHEAVADPRVRQQAQLFLSDDVIPGLGASPIDLPRYRDAVLARFGNVALNDTLERIASDSYAKLRVFVMPTLIARQQQRAISTSTLLPLQLFVQFVLAQHSGAIDWPYRDPDFPDERRRALAEAAEPLAMLCADPQLWSAKT